MRRALVVTSTFPYDLKTDVVGIYQRLRIFISAIARISSSITILFYVVEDPARRSAADPKALSDYFGTPVEPVVSTVDRTRPASLWRYFSSGLLDFTRLNHSLRSYRRYSGSEQVAALEDCLSQQPDFIFAHRLASMCPLLLTTKSLPPIVFDLDDVEHRLYARTIGQLEGWRFKSLLYTHTPSILLGERRAARRSAATLVCSEADRRLLRARWRLPRVEVLPNSTAIPRQTTPAGAEEAILFLGSMYYRPNLQAARELIATIWPRIVRQRPAARLIIAGSQSERLREVAGVSPGVEVLGFAEDLGALYSRARVVCCPLRFGGGTRIKIIEAAAHARPVVSTRIGAEGLAFRDEESILIRDDPDEIAAACADLLADPRRAAEIGAAARRLAIDLYGQDAAISTAADLIASSVSPGA